MERFCFAGEDERWEQPGRVPAGAIRPSGQENGFSPQRHLQVKRIRTDLFQIRTRPLSSFRIRIHPTLQLVPDQGQGIPETRKYDRVLADILKKYVICAEFDHFKGAVLQACLMNHLLPIPR